jgi:AcrR family transcriptional regulator
MLEVAAREFAAHGYHATSMDRIATTAGVSKPMLYSYFGSKEGLFAAVAEAAAARLRQRLRAVVEVPGRSPDDRLWAGFLEVFEFVDQHRDGWRVLYPAGDTASGPVGAGARRAREAMARLLAELFYSTARELGIGEQAAAQSEMLAHAVTGATIASASWWLERPDEPKELAALRLMNLVWNGFGGLIDGRLWAPPPSAL